MELWQDLVFAGAPLGLLAAGAVPRSVGIAATMLAVAALFLAVAVALALSRGPREMDHHAGPGLARAGGTPSEHGT